MFITNFKIAVILGINVNISLATVGNKNLLTKGVIKLTTSDSWWLTVQTDSTRLNASCTNGTFQLKANHSQVYVTLKSSIIELSSDDYDKVSEISIEFHPIGYPLINDACTCRSELSAFQLLMILTIKL